MRLDELIDSRNRNNRPLTGREYERLKNHFFFNLPIIENEDGEILNPPKNKELFSRFLSEAQQRGETFNPIQDYATR